MGIEIEEFVNASDDFKRANPDVFKVKTPKAKLPQISEADFQNQVVAIARANGWKVAHFRGVRVQRKDGSVYYQTPVGADGRGFPDLVFARIKNDERKIIFAELKSNIGKLSDEQYEWVKLTGAYVWRPNDIEDIERILT